MGPTTEPNQARSYSTSKWMTTLLVVILALFLGYPQPDLKFHQDILPMARKYAKNEHVDSPLKGVKVVITGATSGIGLGLTKQFAIMGATVIGMGRSPKKLQTLQESLAKSNGQLVPVQVQLGDLESVQSASEQINKLYDSIDILVNNAGIHYFAQSSNRSEGPPSTPQGIDLSLGVNYLSHYLLTEKMLPLLYNSTHHPTVIQISSTFHFGADGSELVVDAVNQQQQQQQPTAAIPGAFQGVFAEQRAYANSKLAQILHARALQRRHPTLRFKSICPCWVGTAIAGHENFAGMIIQRLAFPHDGFGIRSALQAALDTTAALEEDWFTNSRFTQLGHAIFPTKFFEPWVYQSTPIRDIIIQSFATLMLPLQKFWATIEARRSSPESYNETLQESLYGWSYRTVHSYL
jgi:NAD(P)-dependent dehydrogenase (short-subunit alcohol dehydrogenase family)